MTKYNPANERIKRQYFDYLREAKRLSVQTVDAVAKSLSRFEEFTRYREFKRFRYEQATAFKRHLAEQTGIRSGEKLSMATQHATLKQLRAFFLWLAGQPGFKSRLQYSDADYFNLPDKGVQIAMARHERKAPTLEQVKHTILAMPVSTEIERRNRALLAFALLTGARDAAIASMKLRHVDLNHACVYQDAREVKTKFSKTFTTFFFKVGDEVEEILADWIRFLRKDKLWSDDDPLFPVTRSALGPMGQFEAVGLDRAHWSSATPIRAIFRAAFQKAGLPYFNPHSLRKTLAKFGEQTCQSPEEFKAWSQNLGHEHVLTTLTSYGKVPEDRQAEIIRGLALPRQTVQPASADFAKMIAREILAAGATLPAERRD